jgi:hypothetical protein
VQCSNFTLLCSEPYAFVAQPAALWQRSRDDSIFGEVNPFAAGNAARQREELISRQWKQL